MGSFDYLAGQSEPLGEGRLLTRMPAMFGETFELALDLAKQSTPFGGMLDLSGKQSDRAKTIFDITGDQQLRHDLTYNPGDLRNGPRIESLATKYPGYIKTDKQLLEELKAQYAKKREQAAYAMGETTSGGTFGKILGGMAGGVIYDPVMWMALPAGAAASSAILRRAAVEAGINFLAEIASIGLSADWRNRMDNPVTGDEFLIRSAMATGTGAVFGGVVGIGAHFLKKLSDARAPRAAAMRQAEAATPSEAKSDPTIIDLAEGDRILYGQPFSRELRTVGEAQTEMELALDIGDLETRQLERQDILDRRYGSQQADKLKQDYAYREQWNTTRDIEAAQLKYDALLADRFETLNNLHKTAPSYYRKAIEKDIEDLTFYKEAVNDMITRDAEIARVPEPHPYVTQTERDAAWVLDQLNDMERTSPFVESAATYRIHTIAVGKAINDIDDGVVVNVDDILRTPIERSDGSFAPATLRKEFADPGAGAEVSPRAAPSDFPKSPEPVVGEDRIQSLADEVAVADRREFDELMKTRPAQQTAIEIGQAEKMRNAQFETGEARKIIEDLKLTESEIAAVKACMTGGGQ